MEALAVWWKPSNTRYIIMHFTFKGSPMLTWNHFQPKFCQIALHFNPPPLKQTDALGQIFFAENEKILSDFDFGDGYFDNDYG